MPTTTPVQALPIPILGDTTNGPTAFQNLAQALELKLVMSFATTAARTAAIPVPVAGMVSFQQDTNRYEAYIAGGWVPLVGGAWNVYTPTLTATTTNPTLGNSTLAGAYMQMGLKTFAFRITLTIGSTFGVGSGVYQFAMPATMTGIDLSIGFGHISNSGIRRVVELASTTTTVVRMTTAADGNAVSNTGPGGSAWATGNVVGLSGLFEAA